MEKYTKVDEIPFDFQRRRMSVVVQDQEGKTQLVTKGAVEEMLTVLRLGRVRRKDAAPGPTRCASLVLSQDRPAERARGMRVIAVAQKTNPSPVGQFSAGR